ncbi:Cas10/Cmr2 second palm domain-containing protein [Thermanaeromonas sp. C210]|uniref:Cas10/Cmr2 second palm domain-containing protein n=1 Tax=Thermanaeromonas sp. C210 TaxID=2731925 RepID=UPI0015654313|nr:hypothetical protein [Thermanaeromonas sp. C210]
MFIDWLKEVCDPLGEPAKTERPPLNAFCWVHPVTGSRYYLEREKAAEITRSGLAWVESLVRGKGPAFAAEQLSFFLSQRDVFCRKQYLEDEGFHFDKKEDTVQDVTGLKIPLAALWPELPYPGPGGCRASETGPPVDWLSRGNKPCIRLADFLILRTGLFYALVGDRLLPEEWPKLRLTSLLDGSNVYGTQEGPPFLVPIPEELLKAYEASSLLAGCPQELSSGKAGALLGELPPLEIVEGGAFKVKDYYLETNRIGEIRGASVLLDDINRKRYYRMFSILPGLTAESLVYAGGGHVMAVVPAGRGETVAGEIERLHREVCLTARAVGVSCRAHVADLACFRQLRQRLSDEITVRRNALVPAWDTTEGDLNLYSEEFPTIAPLTLPKAGAGEWCASCGLRPALRVWPYQDEERPLCASCLRKQIAGQKAGKTVFAEDYHRFWRARGEEASLPSAQEIDDIADFNNEIAVIYADGNSFGSLFSQCDSLGQLRCLSQFTENAAYTATFTVLKEYQELLNNRAVEIIALGGDDILTLVPAQAALPVATALGKSFDRLFKNLSEDKPAPTLSLGVVIAGAKTPVRYLFELAKALLKEAKKRVYEDAYKGKRELREGTLDVAVLTSHGGYEDNIATYRSKTFRQGNVNLTLRPYTFTEALSFMEAVRRLRAARQAPGRSWFYGLRLVVEHYGQQVAELYFNYQFSRLSEEQRETLRDCWYPLTGLDSDPAMFFEREGRYYCPWLDVVELWNYVGAGGESR